MRRMLAALAVTATATVPALADPLAQLLARTDRVAREVAAIRGLKLKRPIRNEIVDQAVIRQRLIARAADAKHRSATLADGLALARWGMIPLTTDYPALLLDLRTEQVAGYYDPETQAMTISREAAHQLDWAEMVLTHEIDHGLQDQHFDLERFGQVPDGETDAALARRALVEGDGIAVMVEVMLARKGMAAPWSDPEVALSIEKAMSVPGDGDKLDRAPLAVREALVFPYRAGLSFVAALRRRQPWSAVDAAFRRPPSSSEQVLHPERYLAGDEPVVVRIAAPPALADHVVVHEAVWGELGFSLFLRSHGVDASTAALAADGWGGDRVVTLVRDADRRPQRAVGIARFQWDSEADAIEAAEAAHKALEASIAGATIDHSFQRTRWMALDGTVSWIERRADALVIAVGVPAWAVAALGAELWAHSSITTPAPPSRRKRSRR